MQREVRWCEYLIPGFIEDYLRVALIRSVDYVTIIMRGRKVFCNLGGTTVIYRPLYCFGTWGVFYYFKIKSIEDTIYFDNLYIL